MLPDFQQYGPFIWGAYGAAFLILSALVIATFIKRVKLRDALKRHDT